MGTAPISGKARGPKVGSEAKLELSPISVVRSAARAFERDRYLSALLAPAAARDDLIALAAFAGELARIPATVSEPMIGEIRLQWWRDTLEAAGTDGAPAAGHPIADALVRAARRHGIATADLQALVAAQPDRDTRSADEILGYDAFGLPR